MGGKDSILKGLISALVCSLSIAAGSAAADDGELEYEPGGPLAGVVLPLFPTQHGEEPGYPGVIPGEHGKQGLYPMYELYPGSVEHYRKYWQHYLPAMSLYDRQSQVRNFVAPNIPGAGEENIAEYAAPVYWVGSHAAAVDTGRRNAPVPVVVMNAQGPRLNLDLGELDRGMYALRVIGAVDQAQLTPFRRPMAIVMTINDGPDGEASTYRFRPGVVDEFYSVAEFFFHAPETRQYNVELWMDERTELDLQVHNISVDDVLVGATRRPLKTKVVRAEPRDLIEADMIDARLQRDEWIWNIFPPLNAQGRANQFWQAGYRSIMHNSVTVGAEGKTAAAVDAEHGAWEAPHNLHRRGRGPGLFPQDYDPDIFLVNNHYDLTYSRDDLENNRPLPEPYPYRDDGLGLVFVDNPEATEGYLWAPIAAEAENIIRNYPRLFYEGADAWRQRGDEQLAHDGAIALVQYALNFPALDSSNYLGHVARDPSAYGRNYRNRRRETTAMYMDHYANYLRPIFAYDHLFDYIKDNQALAESVGRFVPWVETPDDVIELIDTYLVQMTAKRILRYHLYTGSDGIAKIAIILNDEHGTNLDATDPWMDWLFSRAFIYPLPLAGIQDTMITGTDRGGARYIGSSFYARGGGAMSGTETIEEYIETGGNPKYDLRDPARYPKPLSNVYWYLDMNVAGREYIRTGSVTGPERAGGEYLGDTIRSAARSGWRWSRDPVWAFILKHMVGQDDMLEPDWWEVEEAAAEVERAPWLDLPSRVIPNWAGVLETGHQHDDYRFRRAAFLRTGYGWGHHHHDPLTLNIIAHGSSFALGDGQRPGYSTPNARFIFINNSPTINNQNFMSYCWVRDLADMDGARYLRAGAEPPSGGELMERQLALIDVDEGSGSEPLAIDQQVAHRRLAMGVKTANSYVFDVVRLYGGRTHTYNFHGSPDDEFAWNVKDGETFGLDEIRELAGENQLDPRRPLLSFGRSDNRLTVGSAPDKLEATWRMSRGDGNANTERAQLGPNFDNDAPRRFIRMRLMDAADAVAMTAPVVGHTRGYEFTNMMIARHNGDEELSTAFPAIFEPYVGDPFITDAESLEIAENENDALRAVAARVLTANGHNDVVFADGRPESVRNIPEAGVDVSGAFALYSTDDDGLRQASLTGGTVLNTPRVRLNTAYGERTANVVEADYLARQMKIDADWPNQRGTYYIEIGTPDVRNMSSYGVLGTGAEDGQTRLTVDGGADFYRSEIVGIDEQAGVVECALSTIISTWPGRRRNWAASNDDMTVFWRADHAGGNRFRLRGAPVNEEAFGEAGVLRLWEYGVGDVVRQQTNISLRRINDGVYAITGNVDAAVSLLAGEIAVSTDGEVWEAADAEADGEWRTINLTAVELAEGAVYLRVQ